MLANAIGRITPAYAGNTTSRLILSGVKKDHPRLRGEHDFQALLLLKLLGSPPPTRGTLIHHLTNKPAYRITPAYAGNTLLKLYNKKSRKDHPRLRGEHFEAIERITDDEGSPPPTRGTLNTTKTKLDPDGITPAYAGNTPLTTK